MLFLLMSLVAAVILFPVLYFLPLSLTMKGKAILTVLAFAISAASFAAMDYIPLWQLFGLMAILVLVISYVGASRMEGFLLLSTSADMDEVSSPRGADILFGRRKKQELPADSDEVLESYNANAAVTDPVSVLPRVSAEPDEGYIAALHEESEEQVKTPSREDLQSIEEEVELAEPEMKEEEPASDGTVLYSEYEQDEDYISPLEDLLDENEANGKVDGQQLEGMDRQEDSEGRIPDIDRKEPVSEDSQDEDYISPLEDLLVEDEIPTNEDDEKLASAESLNDNFIDWDKETYASGGGQDEGYISPLEDLLAENEIMDKVDDHDLGNSEYQEDSLEDTSEDGLETVKEEETGAQVESSLEELEQDIPLLEDNTLEELPSEPEEDQPEVAMDDTEADETLQIPEWDELEPQEVQLDESEPVEGSVLQDESELPAERQFMDTFLQQIEHYEEVMEPDELEVFIKTHLSESLPDSFYFLVATELLKLYQNTKQLEKFHRLAVSLNVKYEHYPLLQEQIRFLYEQFLITNQRW